MYLCNMNLQVINECEEPIFVQVCVCFEYVCMCGVHLVGHKVALCHLILAWHSLVVTPAARKVPLGAGLNSLPGCLSRK